MNFYTKVALGVLGVGAIGGAWYADDYYTKKETEEKTASSKALDFATEKVRRISLKTPEGLFAFERKDGTSDWAFVEPKEKAAVKPDQDAVNNLVSAVQSANVETTLEGTEKAVKPGAPEGAAYGLTTPRAELELTLEGGAKESLVVGNDVGVGSGTGSTFNALSVYAATPKKPKLLVVGSNIVSATKRTFSDFRTKVAGDFKTADVKGIAIIRAGVDGGAGTRIEITKGDKDWKITAPRELAADNNNVGLFLDRWARLRTDKVTEAADVNEASKPAMGLAAPTATLEVRAMDGKVLQKFDVGLTKDSIFVTLADGAVGTVDLNQFADLIPELKYFRDRRVLRDVAMSDVTRLQTKTGSSFLKEGANWYRESAADEMAKGLAGKPAADGKTTTGTPAATASDKATNKDAFDVFSQWEFLTADEVIDNPSGNLSEYGLDAPIASVRFAFKDGGPKPVDVIVGNRVPKNEKLVYVKRADKPEVFVVETQWLDALARMDGKAPATAPGAAPDGPAGTTPQAKK